MTSPRPRRTHEPPPASQLPLGQVRPGSRLLETEIKLITHATWMNAYKSESALAQLLHPHFARSDREGRALLREAFNLPGDLQIIGTNLILRYEVKPAPNPAQIKALCPESWRHTSLNSHKYHSISGDNGADVWESYLENRSRAPGESGGFTVQVQTR